MNYLYLEIFEVAFNNYIILKNNSLSVFWHLLFKTNKINIQISLIHSKSLISNFTKCF